MICNNSPRLFFIPVLLTILAAVSCQRELSFIGPERVVEQLKDSTLLIKSITYLSISGTDSIVESYSYDSVKRKIMLSWNDPAETIVPDGSKAEFSYNDQWLLAHVVYIYPAGYIATAFDYATIDIGYDAANVLQNMTITFGDGSIESKIYTKTLLSSGNYQLNWDETVTGQNDQVLRRAVFNADGKNIVNVLDYSFVAGISATGEEIFTNFIGTDSLFYDVSRSVTKIVRTEVDTFNHTRENFISYEFTRQSKGDQLYNQRQGLMRGIADIPIGDFDSPSDAFGVLSLVLDYEYLQYSKYPIQTAKIYNWNTNNYNFTATSEFDSHDRLTKFTGFFLDLSLTSNVYKIKYYK